MITIEQEPDQFTPAYERQDFVVSSDNTSQPNFKFVCDIYIDSTLIKRMTRPAHPDFNSARFDTHRIIESFVTHDINLTATDGVYKNENSFVEFQCKFGEEYGLDSSGVTVYDDLATSSFRYAINASPNSNDFVDWDGSEYVLDSSGGLFLHDYPTFYDGKRGGIVLRGQNQWAYFITLRNKVDRLVITTYDENRSLIDEYQIDNPYVSVSTDADQFLRCATGYNANDIDQAQLITGTQPIFTADVKYYEVYTVDASNNLTSETLYFEISDNCSVFDTFELTWLNRLGGFDTFIFDHAHTENIKIDRKQYKQQVGTMAATSFTVTKADRGYQNYFTSSNSELKLRSGWITENEFSWVRFLKESPQVFIISNGELISVNVTDSDYEVKQVLNTNLINFEVTVKYSVNNYRQRY